MTDGLDRTKQGKRHHEVKTYVVHQGVYEKSPAVKTARLLVGAEGVEPPTLCL